MRVLLLEDQSDLRDAVAGRLRADHAVDEARDLAEADPSRQPARRSRAGRTGNP